MRLDGLMDMVSCAQIMFQKDGVQMAKFKQRTSLARGLITPRSFAANVVEALEMGSPLAKIPLLN